MISILKYGETPNSELFARSMPTVSVEETVAEILRGVKERGDAALREYAEKFDHVRLDSLIVSEEEMREALDPRLYIGRCPEQVDALVSRIRPLLMDAAEEEAKIEV